MIESVVIPMEYWEDIESLTVEQRGQLLTAIFAHRNGEEYEVDETVEAVFRPLRRWQDKALENYKKASDAHRESGKLGGRPRKENQMVSDENQKNQMVSEKTKWLHSNQIKSNQVNSNISSPCRESETDSDFEEFWSAYPKKVGKPDAMKSFVKAIKKTSLPEMIRAIEAAKSSRQWKDRQYIPNPSTWLNQERWNDELEEAKVETKPPEKRYVVKDSKLEGYASTIDYSVVDDMLYWG